MNERFRVIFNGEYAPGADPIEVVVRIENAFNMTRLRVLAMIGRPPAIIHQGLDLMAATQEMQALAGLGLLNGCGSGGSSSGGGGGTQPVTSTVTVTATSGSLTHTATFKLTVN